MKSENYLSKNTLFARIARKIGHYNMNAIHIDITANYKTRHKRRARIGRQEVYGDKQGNLIALVPLPFGLGLTLGCSSLYSVRSWAWAQYDYADHSPANSPRWANRILDTHPAPSTRLAVAVESWKESKTWKN
jgi:hypothetical protein